MQCGAAKEETKVLSTLLQSYLQRKSPQQKFVFPSKLQTTEEEEVSQGRTVVAVDHAKEWGATKCLGVSVNSVNYISLLSRCNSPDTLTDGRRVHAHLLNYGYLSSSTFCANHVVRMYGKCGSAVDAKRVFDGILHRNEYSWAAMILAYARNDYGEEALALFREMNLEGVPANKLSFIGSLVACSSMAALAEGKKIHDRLIGSGIEIDNQLGATLVDFYGRCGCLTDARSLFDRMGEKNLVVWTAMISAYARHGCGNEAIDLYKSMDLKCHPDAVLFVSVLTACTSVQNLNEGMVIHKRVIDSGLESNVIVANALLRLYGKCRKAEAAEEVFMGMVRKTMVSWNLLISAYSESGHVSQAMKIFKQMDPEGVKPDAVTFLNILSSFSSPQALGYGRFVHTRAIECGFHTNVHVATALVSMYGRCGSVQDATWVFENIPYRNMVSWTALVAAYSHNGYGREALEVYREMDKQGIRGNAVTFITALDACSEIGAVKDGKEIHMRMIASGIEMDVVVETALVTMYGRCGSLGDAKMVFDGMRVRNSVTWNAMMSSCVRCGDSVRALEAYRGMDAAPDAVTYVVAMAACGCLGALLRGREVYERMTSAGMSTDVTCLNAAIGMYGRCGSVPDAWNAFWAALPVSNVVTWTAMIAVLGQHGQCRRAVELLREMQLEGVLPDDATFVCAMWTCGVGNMLKDGRATWFCMIEDYGVKPNADHYDGAVDLLARCGFLKRARELIDTMPYEPRGATWMSLLAVCRKHSLMYDAEFPAERAMEIDPKNPAPYIMMSHLYGGERKWVQVSMLKERMELVGVVKHSGRSYIETKERVHEFGSGEVQEENIVEEIHRVKKAMKSEVEVEDEVEVEVEEGMHSVKVAVAFGVVATLPGTLLRVTKNIRVCMECHRWIKFMAKYQRRTIVVRDSTGFHTFNADGACSCGDHW